MNSPIRKTRTVLTTTTFATSVANSQITALVHAPAYVVAWAATDTGILSLRSSLSSVSSATSAPVVPGSTNGTNPNNGSDGSTRHPLSTGGIVGIAVGIGAIIIIGFALTWWRMRNSARRQARDGERRSDINSNMEYLPPTELGTGWKRSELPATNLPAELPAELPGS